MARSYDVVVIGGAVMGCSVAYWLTRMQPGLSVLVVEQDPSFARSSTALSVASIRQQFTTRVNVEISRFGIGFIREFQSSLGVDVGIASLGLKENGYLFLTATAEGAAPRRSSLGRATPKRAASARRTPSGRRLSSSLGGGADGGSLGKLPA